jgi:methylphosphotriester-DNA--protein-cysteine methyltransferase
MTTAPERLYLRLAEDTTHGPESGTPAGSLRAFTVAPSLRAHVATLMACRETLPDGQVVHERVLPDGAVRLVLNFGDAPSAGEAPAPAFAAIGASAAPTLVRLHGRVHGLSLTLQPGAADALLGVPGGEIAARAVPLDALWGADAARLRERLADAADDEARAAVLQATLLQRLRHAHGPCATTAAAWRSIARGEGRRPLREVAQSLGIGERRLQQLFRHDIGVTPRAAGRLARLHGLLRALRGPARPRWAELAYERGFADQSHLANEFRALAGITPTQFLERAASPSCKTAR